MDLDLVDGPASEPVSVEEVKQHCRIDGSDEDSLIPLWIAAARQMVEVETSTILLPQQWQLRLDAWPSDPILIPLWPLRQVDSISYLDINGVSTTLSSSRYRVTSASGQVRLTPAYGVTWPVLRTDTAAVTILVTAGYANADAVPAACKQAILMLCSHLDQQRSVTAEGTNGYSLKEIPLGIRRILARVSRKLYV